MAHVLSTGEGGENPATNGSSLKMLLCQKHLTHVYEKLMKNEITADTLLFLNDKNIDELCVELNLSVMEKLKFISCLKKLKLQIMPSQNSIFIPITFDDKKCIDKIEFNMKQCDDLQNILEKYFNEIDSNVIITKKQVDEKINNIIVQLRQRQKSLLQQIDQWKLNKLDEINRETSNIIQYRNDLKQVKLECEELIKNKPKDNKIDKNIQTIVNDLLDKYKYAKYQGTDAINKFIHKHIKFCKMQFQDPISCNNINSFGNVKTDISNIMLSIPSLTLSKPVKILANIDGYKIKLHCTSSRKLNKYKFIVKYCDCSDFDEKKNDTEVVTWSEIKYDDVISNGSKTSFEFIGIDTMFQINQSYKFMIQCIVQQPLNLILESNVSEFIVERQLMKYDYDIDNYDSAESVSKNKSVEMIEILLKYYKHRGHYLDDDNYHPQQLLRANNKFYGSQTNSFFDSGDKEDWIIFEYDCNEETIYIPRKLVIRNHDSGSAIKLMNVSIGDANNRKWFDFILQDNKICLPKDKTQINNKLIT
eukprot:274712_1